MADIDIERRPRGSILPWIVGLAILSVIVGWLLWRNNRLPEIQGALDLPDTAWTAAPAAFGRA